MSENLCTEFACVCNWSETYKYVSVFTRTSKLILISNQQHHQNGIQVHVSRCKVFSWRAKQVNLQWEQWNCGCSSGKNDLHCLYCSSTGRLQTPWGSPVQGTPRLHRKGASPQHPLLRQGHSNARLIPKWVLIPCPKSFIILGAQLN